MKYIRTIDTESIDNQKILEVYEITKGTEFEGLIYKCYTRHNDFTEVIVFDCNVIKQADTIEELCDEFVIPKFRDVFVIDRFSKQICINHIKCGNGDVYGAIWTDKGLIYVAKMNSDGKLVLI